MGYRSKIKLFENVRYLFREASGMKQLSKGFRSRRTEKHVDHRFFLYTLLAAHCHS